MGLMKQKILGAWGELKGRFNRSAGALSGDRSREVKGAGQETVGRVRRGGAEAIEHGLDKAEGSVAKAERKLDELTGKRPPTNGNVRDYRVR